MKNFQESILQLVIETSTNLPPDVRRAVKRAADIEDPSTRSGLALRMIAQNIDMATDNVGPICQDTGLPTFEIHTPAGVDQLKMTKEIEAAIAKATKLGKLRNNSVDSLTGKNSGNNLGPGTPVIHFHQWKKTEIEIRLILKGGGCENKNIQYSLPMEIPHLGRADRTMEGIRKCLLHSVWQAQGHGCSIGAIGVAIGGDRASGYAHAKGQLFRSLDDVNKNPELAKLEDYVMDNSNKLGIGTMGFGGKSTLIGCKVGVYNRLPASFFVSVAYNCWAYRRLGVIVDPKNGKIKKWLYKEGGKIMKMAQETGLKLTGREVRLTTPISEEQIRSLHVGDVVLLDGTIHTGRDAVHHHLISHDAPIDLHGQLIYHCGPVVIRKNNKWVINAAGPTTSSREEPFQGDIIRKFGIRGVIGKGGMGAKTLAALKECGAVYLNAIGGAAQYYAGCITDVSGVDFLDFGIPEAMWHMVVKDFPAIVTMDAHGNSLHADVEKASAEELAKLMSSVKG
jgi:fumarate hydratase class I